MVLLWRHSEEPFLVPDAPPCFCEQGNKIWENLFLEYFQPISSDIKNACFYFVIIILLVLYRLLCMFECLPLIVCRLFQHPITRHSSHSGVLNTLHVVVTESSKTRQEAPTH